MLTIQRDIERAPAYGCVRIDPDLFRLSPDADADLMAERVELIIADFDAKVERLRDEMCSNAMTWFVTGHWGASDETITTIH